ncbi:MAG TPA: HDIG domain-containing protein [candidate division Zixibacteria bacterium]|nr:HDIG domain-containing protein [candidate division Zixibacteria bacterium]
MFIPRTLAETEDRDRGPWLRAVLVALALAAALWAVLTVNVTTGQVNLQVGDVAPEDIRAPFAKSFVSESETEERREEAAAAVPDVYVPIAPRPDIREDQLRAFDSRVRIITAVLNRRDSGSLAADEVAPELDRVAPELSSAQVEQLAAMPQTTWERVAEAGRTVLDDVLAGSIREDRLADVRAMVRSNITNELAPAERELAGDLAALYVVPNEQYSEEETEAARRAAREAVDPVVISVQQGETIVRTGERIEPLHVETLEELGLTREQTEVSTLAANGLIAALIAVLLVAFLWRFEPEIWFRNRSLLLFGLALVVTAVALRLAADRTLWVYVVPAAATVLLTAILLDGAAGMAMAVTLAVLAGVMNRDALLPATYVLAGGIVSVVAIVGAERLNAFVRAGILLALTNVTVLLAFHLLDQRDVTAILQGIMAGGVNAGLSVVLAVGSFAVLGNLFGIMTVFELLELANPSNRLLRRLLLETPGTYHHSVMVGNLAERAAETIGADPLLARVAAYYHDIGKMKNPLAFIENQAGSRNIHDDLTAEVSARIIASHIRDGIDLAYEHGLPVQVIGFIPQHHGTSVMSYFYGKALREVGGREDLVNRDLFRYPGPKPQSREAAILMLADGVEASVRSLDDKDEASIRAMVDRIVDARVEDGQLDDADLTLKNIAQIKEAFVQQLLGMYHSRIKYPDNVVPIEQPRREQA